MRARSGPELQAWEDLAEQDEQNLKLGLGDVMAIADYVIPNGSYAGPFEQLARHICHLLAQQCAAESI
jgi:hypothetical protein